MGKTPPGTVKETGAKAGDILVGHGSKSLNRGMRIKVHRDQPKGEGGRIVGSFDLLGSGNGTYASYLEEFVGQSFHNAEELLHAIQAKGAVKATHLLNRNCLRRESK